MGCGPRTIALILKDFIGLMTWTLLNSGFMEAEALIRKGYMFFSPNSDVPWVRCLLRAIPDVLLHGATETSDYVTEQSLVQMKLFLESILKNASIYTVQFQCAQVPVVSLYSTSVSTLELYTCEFEGTELERPNFLLWIWQSMQICKLSLCLFHNADAPPFYCSLAHNAHVKEMEISVRVDLSDVVSEALQYLLENTMSYK
jgi:hypothetical protein